MVSRAKLTVLPNKNLKSGDTLTLTVTLEDAFGNPLTGVDLAQSLTHKQAGNVTWIAQKDGTYTANLVLTKLGQDHLFITADNIQSPTMGIDVKPQLGNNAIHKIDISDITNPTAGAESTFTAVLTDAQGNTIDGIQNLEVTIGKQPLNIAITQQADGRYMGKLPGQQSGSYDLIVSVNKQNSAKKTFVVAKPDTVTASPNGSGQKGQRGVVSQVELTTAITSAVSGHNLPLTITLKDRFNNPLKGVSSNHITLMHKQTGHVAWVDHNNGQYTATIPLKILGNDTFIATVNGINSSATNITVTNSTNIKQVNQLVMAAIPHRQPVQNKP